MLDKQEKRIVKKAVNVYLVYIILCLFAPAALVIIGALIGPPKSNPVRYHQDYYNQYNTK